MFLYDIQSQKTAPAIEDLQRMLALLPAGLSARATALLLVGFAGTFRRSEVVGLNWVHLEFVREGVVITLRLLPTDPEGEGRKVGIPRSNSGRSSPAMPIRSSAPRAATAAFQ